MSTCDEPPFQAWEGMFCGAGLMTTTITCGWKGGRMKAIVKVERVSPLLCQQFCPPNCAWHHIEKCPIWPGAVKAWEDEWWRSNLVQMQNLIGGWWIVGCVHSCPEYQDGCRQMHWDHQSKICGQQERWAFKKLHKSADGVGIAYKLVGIEKIPAGIPC